MPRALVTNDDGIDSPGLHALAAAAVQAGLEVIVAAPAEQSSGASAALTAVRREGRTVVTRRELPGLDGVEAWAVEAQPGHIVVAALNGWFDPAPDVVLSGINHGANVGRAVLHSGTVGAALTAGISDVRGLAVSLDVALHPTGERYWESATAVLPPVLELLLDSPEGTVLSLNVPDRPADDLGPIRPPAWPAAAPCRPASTRSATATCAWARSRCPTSRRRAPTRHCWSPGTRR